jgi:serine/threonine protein kinase
MVPFFTMEYLKGETLAEHIARCGKLPLSEIVQIASQLLDGLSAIHAAGIIHRDLKPENVFLLTTEGGTLRIVVMDFGLARPLDRQSSLMSSEDSSTSGTPAYMAPEQALGTSASTAWDIYAFGVILFRLASGELPFRAINSVALATARLRESAPLLSHVVPGVDPRLETIVSRCLEREPAKRFANVSEIQCAISKINGRERTKPKRRWRLNVPILLASVGLALAVVRSDIQKLSPWRIAPHSPTLTQAPPGGLEPNSSSVGGRSHPIAEDRCVIPAK